MLEKILMALLILLTIRVWINTNHQNSLDFQSPFSIYEQNIVGDGYFSPTDDTEQHFPITWE